MMDEKYSPAPEEKKAPDKPAAIPVLAPAASDRYAVEVASERPDLDLSVLRRRVKAVHVDGQLVGTAFDFRLAGQAGDCYLACTVVVENIDLFRSGVADGRAVVDGFSISRIDG